MLLNILQYTGDPLTTKNDLSENVNSANVDKPCSLRAEIRRYVIIWVAHD